MRVAFLGLGAIGTPMAARCAAVHQLVVWNRTSARAEAFAVEYGAAAVATPREAASASEVVITCLPLSADVMALLDAPDGLLAGLRPGSLLVDCTSGDPETSRRIAARLAQHDIGFVDAPVSGGPPLAREGRLTVMCGGSHADVARAGEAVAPFAGKVVHLGEVGTGHALKAINNSLLASQILAAAEGLVLAAKAGIRPAQAVEVINASSGRSFVTEVLVPERVLTGAWPPLFRLALMEKDVGIMHNLAGQLGVADPVLGEVREQLRQLRSLLGENADYLDPIRDAESRAGVELRA